MPLNFYVLVSALIPRSRKFIAAGRASIWETAVYDKDNIRFGLMVKDRRTVDGIYHVVLSFAGSDDSQDWEHNRDVLKMPFLTMDARVHSGFMDQWVAVRNIIIERLNILTKGTQVALDITGHSLGGALGTLAALDLSVLPNVRVNKVVVFGAPRVGDENFQRLYDQNLKAQTRRIINGDDIVTRVPVVGYRHVGNEVRVGKTSPWWIRWFIRRSQRWKAWYDHGISEYKVAIREKFGSYDRDMFGEEYKEI